MTISGRKLAGLKLHEEGLVFKFPVGIDLTNLISETDVSMDILNQLPALEIRQLAASTNKVSEVMLFEFGSRGFMSRCVLSQGVSGGAMFRYPYRLRAFHVQSDGFVDPSAQQCVGIAHGNFVGAQPWPGTSAVGTIAHLRLMGKATAPYDIQLAYSPGNGGALVTKVIGQTEEGASGDIGFLMELVVDYPNRMLEGWINGKQLGVLPMTGWNGSTIPNVNSLGRTPWMSVFSASGSGAGAQNWYHAWSDIEMVVPLNKFKA